MTESLDISKIILYSDNSETDTKCLRIRFYKKFLHIYLQIKCTSEIVTIRLINSFSLTTREPVWHADAWLVIYCEYLFVESVEFADFVFE